MIHQVERLADLRNPAIFEAHSSDAACHTCNSLHNQGAEADKQWGTWRASELMPRTSALRLIQEIVFFFVVLRLLALASFRVYKITWRFVGIPDLVNIFLATLIAELVLVFLSLPNSLLPNLAITGLSKRIFFVDGIASFGLIAALRVSKRLYFEVIRDNGHIRRGEKYLYRRGRQYWGDDASGFDTQ